MGIMKGIDISGWQQPSIIEKMNPDFCIIKATEGVGYTSDGCKNHVNAWYAHAMARKKKAYTGFYHFARPDLGNGPEAEAKSFVETVLNIIKGRPLYPILALDWEGKALNYGPDWAYWFLEAVKTAIPNTTPFIYMSSSVTRGYDWSKVAKIARLWVAAYTDNLSETADIHHWKHYSIWQWTDTPCDQDKFMATGTAWELLSGVGKPDETHKEWKITSSTDDKIILERV